MQRKPVSHVAPSRVRATLCQALRTRAGGGDIGCPVDQTPADVSSFPGENCWLCGKWRKVNHAHVPLSPSQLTVAPLHGTQFKFEWRAPVSGPLPESRVVLRTDFDDWDPSPMVPTDRGRFALERMVRRPTRVHHRCAVT